MAFNIVILNCNISNSNNNNDGNNNNNGSDNNNMVKIVIEWK